MPARQHLDLAADAADQATEPWFTTAQLLAEARLLVGAERPQAALRLLSPVLHADARAGHGSVWTNGLPVLAAADALMSMDEPRRALELLDRTADIHAVERGLLEARALTALGEPARARTALSSVLPDLVRAPLSTQIESWLMGARLASEAGRPERARVLVDRALREAGRETMRRSVSRDLPWLLPLVETDAELRRTHRGFLNGIMSSTTTPSVWVPEAGRGTPAMIETLTVREAQVLGLLAQMCSTEEIASELFLSANTIKTYVRGILRKLSVQRRVDAVRRGRELGLC